MKLVNKVLENEKIIGEYKIQLYNDKIKIDEMQKKINKDNERINILEKKSQENKNKINEIQKNINKEKRINIIEQKSHQEDKTKINDLQQEKFKGEKIINDLNKKKKK